MDNLLKSSSNATPAINCGKIPYDHALATSFKTSIRKMTSLPKVLSALILIFAVNTLAWGQTQPDKFQKTGEGILTSFKIK